MVNHPQDVALAAVVKGIAMFKDLHVPTLGVVENMSYYQYPHCGEREYRSAPPSPPAQALFALPQVVAGRLAVINWRKPKAFQHDPLLRMI